MKALRHLLYTYLLLVTSSWAQQASSIPAGLILIAETRGRVEGTSNVDGSSRQLMIDMQVQEGTTITVHDGNDSRAVLVFSNGTELTLMPRSSLRIERYLQEPFAGTIKAEALSAEPSMSDSRVTLLQGEVGGRVPSLLKGKGARFILSVNGRDFDMDDSEFKISVQQDKYIKLEIAPRKKGLTSRQSQRAQPSRRVLKK